MMNQPKFFDIHSHVNLADFDQDRSATINRLREQEIQTITVGVDLASSSLAVKLAQDNPDCLFAAVGFHPTTLIGEDDWLAIAHLAADPKVVAIGECGLDYFRLAADEEKIKGSQRKTFNRQLELAVSLDKPLMIHCRPSQGSQDAYLDLLTILTERKNKFSERLRGNFHFFAGDWAVAQKCLDLGFTLSFTGVITFTHDYDEVIKNLPPDSILAETDAPYVAPVSHRGKRGEPIYVKEVVRQIARLRSQSEEEIALLTTANARRVFGV